MINLSRVSSSPVDSGSGSIEADEGGKCGGFTTFSVKGSTMAKCGSVAILFAIVVIVLVVLGESATVRSRTNPKKILIKKKRVTTTVPTTLAPSTTPEPATTALTEELILTTTEGPPETESLADLSEGPTEDPRQLIEASLSPKSALVVRHGDIMHRRRNAMRENVDIPPDCAECVEEGCVRPPDSACPLGLVLDRCSCCYTCTVAEGNRCFNHTLALPYTGHNIGMCGPGLSCQLRNDLEPDEPPEALCECHDKRRVCGSDEISYSTECKLREAAHLNPRLMVKAWRPCFSAPSIPTPMENLTLATGEDLSLGCEVRSFPPPIIHWEYLPENAPETRVLPGDDSSIVVTIRGGPEEELTSSWLQILSVTPRIQGTYYCVGNNNQGTTQTLAQVHVYKSPKVVRDLNDTNTE